MAIEKWSRYPIRPPITTMTISVALRKAALPKRKKRMTTVNLFSVTGLKRRLHHQSQKVAKVKAAHMTKKTPATHQNLATEILIFFFTVPDKGEPHGYIVLATQIFAFMNDHMLCSPCLRQYIRQYTSTSLSEHQLVLLAAIIKDLDRETALTETGTIAAFFGQILGQLFSRFSQSMARYTHNLLAYELLSPNN